jgi:hypothetical protein
MQLPMRLVALLLAAAALASAAQVPIPYYKPGCVYLRGCGASSRAAPALLCWLGLHFLESPIALGHSLVFKTLEGARPPASPKPLPLRLRSTDAYTSYHASGGKTVVAESKVGEASSPGFCWGFLFAK